MGQALAATWWRSGLYDLRVCCNAVLAGMVAITAICPHVDPWCRPPSLQLKT